MNQTDPSSSVLISRKQLALLMGVSIETLKRAERRGELRALKFNARLVRYSREDIIQWFMDSSSTRKRGVPTPLERFSKRAAEIHAAAAKNN